ncbi:MAG: hypothetical protein AAGU14_01270 [Eubacteriaceae bacterium]
MNIKEIFIKFIGILGSFASIIALFLTQTPWTIWSIATFFIGLIFMIIWFLKDIKDYNDKKPIIYEKQEDIEKYMLNWINTGGQVVVYSRNLSWVNDEIKEMMFKKGSELTIFAQNTSKLIEELIDKNVNVYLYGCTEYEPISRFTIIRANRTDKQIAIANVEKRKQKEKHYIYESSRDSMDRRLLDISTDLIEFTKHVVKSNKDF